MAEIYLYSCRRCLTPPNWNSMKMSPCNRLYRVYGGSGWYFDGEQERPFLPEHLYLFPMNAPFRVRHREEDPLDFLYFDFSCVPPLRSERITVLDLAVESGTKEEAALKHLLQALELLCTANDLDTVRLLLEASQSLVCRLGGYSVSRDPRIEKALERIHRIREDGRLDLPSNRELAERLHLDVHYFIRLFRREVGLTPYQYIRNHRLNVAAACIRSGGTVSEAAHLSGYESVAALSHAMHARGTSAVP